MNYTNKTYAKILADSICDNGVRLTTFELNYPHIIHAEFMTHRVFSRNSASSRAIPALKQIKNIEEYPFFPDLWPKNGKGMQPFSYFDPEEIIKNKLNQQTTAVDFFNKQWKTAKITAIAIAKIFSKYKVHKQITNRLVEPFLMKKIIATATNWENYFFLRKDCAAQREIRILAHKMYEEYNNSTPKYLSWGEWHTPLVNIDNVNDPTHIKQEEINDKKYFYKVKNFVVPVSVIACIGRSARSSYMTHLGKRDLEKDFKLFKQLLSDNHMSPAEHAATPLKYPVQCGNFIGWKQFRKFIPNETKDKFYYHDEIRNALLIMKDIDKEKFIKAIERLNEIENRDLEKDIK